MSATSWVEDWYDETPWFLKLVDRGYDVWMASNRGTTYSNVNDKDGQWSDEERWDFSWAEMGKYDQPANIKKILEVTGKQKLTYIGFSQGTEQMIYGLGTNF
jgi:pimeloyl-ACP methyl ester carboxylesterase